MQKPFFVVVFWWTVAWWWNKARVVQADDLPPDFDINALLEAHGYNPDGTPQLGGGKGIAEREGPVVQDEQAWTISATTTQERKQAHPADFDYDHLAAYVHWTCYRQTPLAQDHSLQAERMSCCQMIYRHMEIQQDERQQLCWKKWACGVKNHQRSQFMHFCSDQLVAVPVVTEAAAQGLDIYPRLTLLVEPGPPPVDRPWRQYVALPGDENRKGKHRGDGTSGGNFFNQVRGPTLLTLAPRSKYYAAVQQAKLAEYQRQFMEWQKDQEEKQPLPTKLPPQPMMSVEWKGSILPVEDEEEHRYLGIRMNIKAPPQASNLPPTTSMQANVTTMVFLPEGVKLSSSYEPLGQCRHDCQAKCTLSWFHEGGAPTMARQSPYSSMDRLNVLAVRLHATTEGDHKLDDCTFKFKLHLQLYDEEMYVPHPVVQHATVTTAHADGVARVHDWDGKATFVPPLTTLLDDAALRKKKRRTHFKASDKKDEL